ncbi:hypothetical protein RRG08_020417 [Elysia crispata]|uniref:Uncharacterized protein n=1 Tax=Elysia crispata TaxID=231223 RepID=A0AAE1EAB0_9GAST|nr:hypothetical protein RRG08_020417 [Elysia crispata]
MLLIPTETGNIQGDRISPDGSWAMPSGPKRDLSDASKPGRGLMTSRGPDIEQPSSNTLIDQATRSNLDLDNAEPYETKRLFPATVFSLGSFRVDFSATGLRSGVIVIDSSKLRSPSSLFTEIIFLCHSHPFKHTAVPGAKRNKRPPWREKYAPFSDSSVFETNSGD